MSDHHHHHHHHHHGPLGQLDQKSLGRIRKAFVLNLSFTIIELVGGILTQSMAIIADAVHDLGDSFSLGLALILERKAQDAANAKWTYGYKRLSALSALICALVLTVGSSIVLYEAIPKLWHPGSPPSSWGMMGLAILGTLVNGWAAFGLSKGGSQNEKVLTLHLLEDLLGWVAVLIGALVIHFTGWSIVDPLLAIIISLFILYNVWKNLKGTFSIFLQSIPENVDLDAIEAKITKIAGVKRLRDYHAWSLDGADHVFTCQMEIDDPSRSTQLKQSLREYLKDEGFKHITIEVVNDEEPNCHG